MCSWAAACATQLQAVKQDKAYRLCINPSQRGHSVRRHSQMSWLGIKMPSASARKDLQQMQCQIQYFKERINDHEVTRRATEEPAIVNSIDLVSWNATSSQKSFIRLERVTTCFSCSLEPLIKRNGVEVVKVIDWPTTVLRPLSNDDTNKSYLSLLSLDEAIASRGVLVIVSGNDRQKRYWSQLNNDKTVRLYVGPLQPHVPLNPQTQGSKVPLFPISANRLSTKRSTQHILGHIGWQ